jgi:hypothetical protein
MSLVPWTPQLRDRWLLSLVWAIWFVLLAGDAVACYHYAWNIPYSEDWALVAPLTGNEPHLGSWLWALHHDHRNPLPRLLMLVILKITGGNFGAVVLCNIALIGAATAIFIHAARRIRGRTSFSDAFFPILLLHPGNVENMLWAWQITFVLSFVLISICLVQLAAGNGLLNPRNAAVGGICLILLPLTGAPGLLYAVPLSLWAALLGLLTLRKETGRRMGLTLIAFSCAAFTVVLLYFVGYKASELTGSSQHASFGNAAWMALQCLALSLGPASKNIMLAAIAASMAAVMCGLFVTGTAALRAGKFERRARAAGLLLFLATGCLYAIALARGRGELVNGEYGGWPTRYALLMAPILCAVYFAWGMYGSKRMAALAQYSLLGLLAAAFPLNLAHGVAWARTYLYSVAPTLKDAQAGEPAADIARRSSGLVFYEREELERLIPMLQKAKIRPFDHVGIRQSTMPDKSSDDAGDDSNFVTHQIRYQMPQAERVTLVWGVNGWRVVPPKRRPPGTEIVKGVMNSPMIRQGAWFTATVSAPRDARIDFGFSVVTTVLDTASSPVVMRDDDASYQALVVDARTTDIQSKVHIAKDGSPVYVGGGDLVTIQIQYRTREAEVVYLEWGINGWKLLPMELLPKDTEVADRIHRTRMERKGDIFVANVAGWQGSVINLNFLIRKKRGLLERSVQSLVSPDNRAFQLLRPIFDADASPAWIYDSREDYKVPVQSSEPFEVVSKVVIPEESWKNLPTARNTAFALLVTMALTVVLFGVLSWSQHKRRLAPEEP